MEVDTSLGAMATLGTSIRTQGISGSIQEDCKARIPSALQHGSTWGSWPQTRAVQKNQEEEEVTNTGVTIHRNDTARGQESEELVSAQTCSPNARDISLLQATSIKLDNNTLLAIPHHFQTAYQKDEYPLLAQGENRPMDAVTPSPLGQRSVRAYLTTVPSDPCSLSSRHNAPNTEKCGSPASSGFTSVSYGGMFCSLL